MSRAATVIRRRAEGGYIIGTEHGLVLSDEALTTFKRFADLTDDPRVRTNDGGCDPTGAFVIGTMSYDEELHAGSVYRVTPTGEVTELLAPVTISNGVQWSADNKRVFYIDTPTRRVDVFDFDLATGRWSGRKTHIRVDGTPGFPDGMAIDKEDGLWIALWGAGTVNHYDKDGCFVEAITVPGVTQVSSCAFGGRDRNVLFITTSRIGLRADEEPDAGAIFCVPTAICGAKQAEFDG